MFFFSVSSYEPELFPGLIYRMVKPRVVILSMFRRFRGINITTT